MNKRIHLSLILAMIFVLVLSACSSTGGAAPSKQPEASVQPSASTAPNAAEGDRLAVVTTIYPIYEFTKQVAGEYADVVSIIPTGADSHHWEPSAKDLAELQAADVFVYNGIIEEWTDQVLGSITNTDRLDIVATADIDLMEGVPHTHDHDDHDHAAEDHAHDDHDHAAEDHAHEEHDHDHEHVLDPHVWLSPVLAQQQVKTIAAGLAKADPTNAAGYQANAEAYIAQLQELDQKFAETLGAAKRKEIVTQHQAFGYLAKEYGLTQLSIAGLSTEQEPSPKQMAEIAAFIKEHDVKVIFFETLTSPKIAQTLADETGASTAVLNPLEGLTAADAESNLDYLQIMESNLEALAKGLND